MPAIRRLTGTAGLAALLGGLALSLVACSKDDKSKGASSASVKAAFAVFPKDIHAVVGASPAQFRGSALYSLVEPIIQKEVGGEFAQLREACGADPLELVKSVIIGLNVRTQAGIAVVQGLSRDTLTKCAEGMAKAKGEKVMFTHEDKFTKVVSQQDTTYLVWLDDTTFATGKDMTKEQLAERAAGKDGLDTNQEIMGLLRNVDSSAAVWAVAQLPEPLQVREMGMNLDVSGGFMTIGLKDGLKLDGGARTASNEQATQGAKQLEMFSGMVKAQMAQLQKLTIKASGRDIVAQLSLSKSDLDAVVTQTKGQIEAMMGARGVPEEPTAVPPEPAEGAEDEGAEPAEGDLAGDGAHEGGAGADEE